MTKDEILHRINNRIKRVKCDLDRTDKELQESFEISGEYCFAAGFSRGSALRLNNELVFLKELIGNEA